MKSKIFLNLAIIFLIGCNHSGEPLPFEIISEQSKAYLSSDYVEVFLVGNSDVIAVKFKLPESQTTTLNLSIIKGQSDINIIHYHGPEVSKFVLPQGPARPLPSSKEYFRRSALTGTITCKNLPIKGSFEYNRKIDISLNGINFGDNKLYKVKIVNLTLYAYPP